MPYMLTLTADERNAIDFVGSSYPSGDDLAKVLKGCIPERECDEWASQAWDEPGDVEFTIPESKAWDIMAIRDTEMEGNHQPWPMFCSELASKLNDFVDNIV